MSKELSEMCPLGEKMAKIWLKLQENGEKKSQMAKVMAKEKYILARTLVFATRIVQFLLYLNPKFQASSSFLCLCRPVCVGPVRKPHCWFSHEVALFSVCFV